MKEATHWRKLTNPNYLGSWDILPKDELIVQIISVSKEMVKGADGKSEECIVAKIVDHKPLILNVTNCKTIQDMVDSAYIEDWKNKKVVLYVKKVKAFGGLHEAIRVKAEKVDSREVLEPSSERWEKGIQALKDKKVTLESIKKNFRITPANISLLKKESDAK